MEVGVLLVSEDEQLEYADSKACRLLGFEDCGQLKARWPETREVLQNAIARSGEQVAIVPSSAGCRCFATAYSLPAPNRHLFLLSEAATADPDRLHATQLRSLWALRRSVEHHFRGGLNALAINVELLRGEISGKSPDSDESDERRARYLATLAKEVARLPESLSAVLGRLEPVGTDTQPFDLRQLVEEVRDVIGPQARVHRVALRTTLPDPEVKVEGNRGYLKQALLNLSINALAAMPDGGTLDIEVGVCDGYASVKVKDDGQGMPREYIDNHGVLQPVVFARGSGLYVAAAAVAEFGGTIRIDSAKDTGTIVHVRLPIARS